MVEPAATPPSAKAPADVPGTRIGDVIVNLGYATRDEVEGAFATQKAERASWQKLKQANPDISDADLAKQHPDQVVQQLGQVLKDETKGRVTEEEIQNSLTLQKELRKEFQDKQPSPDEVAARTHELAKEKGIEDKSRSGQAQEHASLDCGESADARTTAGRPGPSDGMRDGMRQQFADSSLRASTEQGGRIDHQAERDPHIA